MDNRLLYWMAFTFFMAGCMVCGMICSNDDNFRGRRKHLAILALVAVIVVMAISGFGLANLYGRALDALEALGYAQ